MTRLTNPATGHQISADDASVEFWTAAGYRAEQEKEPAPKPAPKKSSSK